MQLTTNNKFFNLMNNYFMQFGFTGVVEFIQSTFTPKLLFGFIKIGAILGAITTAIEHYIGLPKPLFVAFVLLFGLDFITGIMAAKHMGITIKSKKMPRIIIKIFTYTVILTLVNSLRAEETILKLLYEWTFWVIFHVIILQLIRSIFENLHNAGFKESSIIYNMLHNKYVKQFEIFTGENPEKLKDETENEN